MPERPTVVRVAEHAGVSVASVSRVLNGLPASPEMLARVRASVEELAYRPNAMARSLKMRRTQQLALGVADVGNPVYVEMMRAIESEARGRGYRLVLSSTGGRPEDVLELLDSLDRGFADGLLLSPLRVDAELIAGLRRLELPVVVIGTVPRDLPVDNVRANSAGGVRLAVEHLHDIGRRRIGFVNGPADTVPGSARARGFGRTVRALGLDARSELRVEADDFTLAAGRDAAEALLDRESPDAIVGSNDLLAIATMQVLHERGLSVPQDVAVVGMDDTELGTVTTPALSSVGLGSRQRGRLAAQLLLERLESPERPPQRVTVQPHLVVRRSSTPEGGD